MKSAETQKAQVQAEGEPILQLLNSLLPSSTWRAVRSITVLAAGGSLRAMVLKDRRDSPYPPPQIIKQNQMTGNTGWWESPVGKGGQKDRIEARGREKLAKINMYENVVRDYTESNKPQ